MYKFTIKLEKQQAFQFKSSDPYNRKPMARSKRNDWNHAKRTHSAANTGTNLSEPRKTLLTCIT